MVDQAPLNRFRFREDSEGNPYADRERRSHHVTSRLLELAELQCQLFASDLKSTVEHFAWPIALLGLGLTALVAALPVLLLGFARWLELQTQLSTASAMLLSGGLALLLALGLLTVATWGLMRVTRPLNRSLVELRRNLGAIRSGLRSDP